MRGYGQFGCPKTHLSHRVSWTIHNGKIPDGLCILHHCDNRSCVNPAHLFSGTPQDNVRDIMKKGRNHFGERSGMSKLSCKKVIRIRELYSSGEYTQEEIGNMFGVHRTNICQIVNRDTWKHIPAKERC